MKHAYSLIMIGLLFTVWQLRIYNIDLLNSAVGYLIILLGIIQEEKHRPISEFKKAKYVASTLFLLELIHPFMPSWFFIPFFITALKIVLPIYLYFCLIKADYMWRPCSQTRTYLQRYLIFSLLYSGFFLLVYALPQLAFILIIMTSLFYTFLFYVLLQLRQYSHS